MKQKSKLKSKLLSLLLITLLTIILAGCGSQTADKNASGKSVDQKPIPVRFGVDAGTFSLQFHVAREKGFFAKHGIEPQISTYSFGIDTLNAALADQVDVGEAMDFAALSRFNTGDLRIISFIQTGKADKTKVVARDGINSPQDIKGKNFGVSKATVQEYIVSRYLDKNGYKEGEVNRVGLTSAAEIFAAFDRGDINLAFFSGTWLDKAVKVPGARIIGSQADIPFEARGFLVVKEKLLKEKPEAAKRILLALDEASQWINEHPEETGEIAFKAVKLPKEAVARDIKDITNEIRLTAEDVAQLKDVYEYAIKNKLIKGGFELKDKIVVDPLQQTFPQKLAYDPAK
ncbi:MAG TPA: ABC transporter substrate-binding protein [Methylomusa anaerophila]|uniref:Putative aliphatic sulfonates-binding protein n=1 Tax=Methylomusa anaerophila TaxID=1930071 RepID=A0A348AEY3_9FIRM|nr:ABC transporter substrate-binding protein [Methylomusa anaerophila]BBB89631.1 putative aliphatic sulfonates-binding protein precursor [Methylomusa anaerophila]HML89593.1 ABC transporter substrate-binding protein [Methylomusa anaerophila]